MNGRECSAPRQPFKCARGGEATQMHPLKGTPVPVVVVEVDSVTDSPWSLSTPKSALQPAAEPWIKRSCRRRRVYYSSGCCCKC